MKVYRKIIFGGLVVLCGSGALRAENWGQWRGPLFNGSTTEDHLPVPTSTADVRWATPLPGPSAATPVVWEGRVFAVAADKATREVVGVGLDTDTGKLLWRQTLSANHSAPGGNDMASCSPVTDGQHVWFITGAGQLAAFTMDGAPYWKRDLAKDYGAFADFFGYSASPLLYEGKLYILVLQNDKPGAYDLNKDRTAPLDSYLLALDPATGQTLWKQARPTDATSQSREAYMTPVPCKLADHTELIVAGGECVTGHDVATGAELWRWWFTPGDRQTLQHVVPTPVATADLIYVIRPEHRPLFALHTGARGTVADAQIAWRYDANQEWIASPLLYRDRLYVLREEDRVLLCMEPRTGRMVWEHKLPCTGALQASPTAGDGKIFCISMAGDVAVLAAGDAYRELGHLTLGEKPCRSAIVPALGRLFIRTGAKLYCLGAAR